MRKNLVIERSTKITTDLAGLRVLNTRPATQAALLSQIIENAGGMSVELPTLDIEPLPTKWLQDLPKTIHHALFVSPNAVYYFFSCQTHFKWPETITTTAIGRGTAKALQSFNITVHHIPETSDSEHLLTMPHLQDLHQHHVLLVSGQGGRTLIADTLTMRGAILHPIRVYQRVLPKKTKINTQSLWQNDEVDIILFTSQQAMQNLFVLLGQNAHHWIMHKPCLVISPRLAAAAAELGIKTIMTSRYDNIISTLEGFKHDKKL